MANKSQRLDAVQTEQETLMDQLEASNTPLQNPDELLARGAELGGSTPSAPMTNDQLRGPVEEEAPRFLETVGAAIDTEWVGSWVLTAAGREDFLPDPDFDMTKLSPEDDAALFEGLPEDMWEDTYEQATSLAHAKAIRSNLNSVMAQNEVLSKAGITGWTTQMLAAIFDPVAIAATLSTEGIAAPAIWGAKIGRGARALRAGVVGGGTELGIEGFKANMDPTRDWKDALFAGSAGFAFGAGFGALLGGKGTSLDFDKKRTAQALADEVRAADVKTRASTAEGPAPSPSTFKVVPPSKASAAAPDGTPDAPDAPAGSVPESAGLDTPEITFDDIEVGELTPITVKKADAEKFGVDKAVRIVEYKGETVMLYKNEGSGSAIPNGGWAASRVDPETGARLSPDVYLGDTLAESLATLKTGHGEGVLLHNIDTMSGKVEGTPATPKVPNDSAGAMRNTVGWEEPLDANADELFRQAELDTPTVEAPFDKLLLRARWDMSGRLMQSEHPMIRKMGTMMSPDSGGLINNGATAAENMDLTFKIHMAPFYAAAEPAFKAWLKENGTGWANRWANRDSFMRAVTDTVRAKKSSGDANIDQTAAAVSKMNADLLQAAKDAGVKGFEDVIENSGYIMRVHDSHVLRAKQNKFGSQQVYKLFGQAIRRVNKELSEEQALHVATAYVRRIERYGEGADSELRSMLSGDTVDTLRVIMREELGDEVSAEWIERTAQLLQKPGEGKHARSKQRMGLDELHKIEMVPQYLDGPPEWVSVSDFLQNNAEALSHSYARNLAGSIGMASIGFKGTGEFASMIAKIKATAGHIPGKNAKSFTDDIAKLELMEKVITGKPIGTNGQFAEAMQMVRDYNFMRVMGQVGFAQIPELANIIGQAGWKASLQHMPALRAMMKRAKNGELLDQFQRDLEALTAPGVDRMLMSPHSRYDDAGMFEAGEIKGLARTLRAGARVVADASFMNPINIALERLSARAIVQRIADAAFSGKTLNIKRLRAMGLEDPALAESVMENIRKHVGQVDGALFGKKISALNMDKWDTDARNAFQMAVNRWSRRMIQKNDVGDLMGWMTSDMGRIVMQFRNFMMVSWSKQLLHGLAMRDFETFTAWTLAMLLGGMTYTAQTSLKSIGRPDQEEYLEERLNPKYIALSAFQRSGFSSILPMLIDTAADFTGNDMPFQYGRTTGLKSSIAGNPTWDLLTGSYDATRGLVKSAVDPEYDFSRKDLRNITNLWMFQSLLGINNGLNALGGELPETSQ